VSGAACEREPLGLSVDLRRIGFGPTALFEQDSLGPVFQEHEFLGASSLPSIAFLNVKTIEVAQCSIESSETEWDEDSGRVELRVQVSAAGAAAKARILFSVTILTAS
jgi:hypothetical protein